MWIYFKARQNKQDVQSEQFRVPKLSHILQQSRVGVTLLCDPAPRWGTWVMDTKIICVKGSSGHQFRKDSKAERIKTAGQHFQITVHDSWGKSHARGVLWQDTELCEPQCRGRWALVQQWPARASAFTSLKFLTTSPRVTLCCHLARIYSQIVFSQRSFRAHSCWHLQAAHKLCPLEGASRWIGGNLGAGSRAAQFETQESRKRATSFSTNTKLCCEKWLIKRMWKRRAFEMVSIRRK